MKAASGTKISPLPPPRIDKDAFNTPSKAKTHLRNSRASTNFSSPIDSLLDTTLFEDSPVHDLLDTSLFKGSPVDSIPDTSLFDDFKSLDTKFFEEAKSLQEENSSFFFESENNVFKKSQVVKEKNGPKPKTNKISQLRLESKSISQDNKHIKDQMRRLSLKFNEIENNTRLQVAEVETKWKNKNQELDNQLFSQKSDELMKTPKPVEMIEIDDNGETSFGSHSYRIMKLTDEIKKMSKAIEETERNLKKEKNTNVRLQKELDISQAEIAGLQRELTDALERVDELMEDNNDDTGRVKDLTEEIQVANEEKEKLKDELEKSSSSLNKSKTDLSNKDVEIGEIKMELKAKIAKILELEMALEEYQESSKEENDDKLEQVKKELTTKHKEEIDSMTAELDKEKQKSNETITQLEEELKKMKQEDDEMRDEIERLSTINSSHYEIIRSLERQKEMYKNLSDNESFRWESSLDAMISPEEKVEKKKNQLRLDDILAGGMSYDDSTSVVSSNSYEATENEKIVSLEKENEMLRLWARKALENVKRLEAHRVESKNQAVAMKKKIEAQQMTIKTLEGKDNQSPSTISGQNTSEKANPIQMGGAKSPPQKNYNISGDSPYSTSTEIKLHKQIASLQYEKRELNESLSSLKLKMEKVTKREQELRTTLQNKEQTEKEYETSRHSQIVEKDETITNLKRELSQLKAISSPSMLTPQDRKDIEKPLLIKIATLENKVTSLRKEIISLGMTKEKESEDKMELSWQLAEKDEKISTMANEISKLRAEF